MEEGEDGELRVVGTGATTATASQAPQLRGAPGATGTLNLDSASLGLPVAAPSSQVLAGAPSTITTTMTISTVGTTVIRPFGPHAVRGPVSEEALRTFEAIQRIVARQGIRPASGTPRIPKRSGPSTSACGTPGPGVGVGGPGIPMGDSHATRGRSASVSEEREGEAAPPLFPGTAGLTPEDVLHWLRRTGRLPMAMDFPPLPGSEWAQPPAPLVARAPRPSTPRPALAPRAEAPAPLPPAVAAPVIPGWGPGVEVAADAVAPPGSVLRTHKDHTFAYGSEEAAAYLAARDLYAQWAVAAVAGLPRPQLPVSGSLLTPTELLEMRLLAPPEPVQEGPGSGQVRFRAPLLGIPSLSDPVSGVPPPGLGPFVTFPQMLFGAFPYVPGITSTAPTGGSASGLSGSMQAALAGPDVGTLLANAGAGAPTAPVVPPRRPAEDVAAVPDGTTAGARASAPAGANVVAPPLRADLLAPGTAGAGTGSQPDNTGIAAVPGDVRVAPAERTLVSTLPSDVLTSPSPPL